MTILDKKLGQLQSISESLSSLVNELSEVSNEYHEDENGIVRNEKGQVTAESLGFYSKKSALDDLKDPWVFNSVAEFIDLCQGGAISSDDGCSRLLFLNKKTFQIEVGGSAIGENGDYSNWNLVSKDDEYGVPTKTVKHMISYYSDNSHQLIGVLWYNR